VQTESSETSQRIASDFLSTPASVETTIRSFYPTPRPSPKPSQVVHQITQHIHVSPGVSLLKPHHITINLPPPDIQRIVQSPAPLLPSQSRVIVTAKASVSDESGRPLNTTQLVTLPLPTIPISYDDYKEGDESFDPFYRDVPKIRKNRQAGNIEKTVASSRSRRSLDQPHRFVYGVDDGSEIISESQSRRGKNEVAARREINVENFQAIKDSLIKFRDILFSDEVSLDETTLHEAAGEIGERVPKNGEASDAEPAKRARDNAIRKSVSLEDLKMEPSRHLVLEREEDSDEEEEEETKEKTEEAEDHAESSSNTEISFEDENNSDDMLNSRSKSGNNIAKSTIARTERNKSQTGDIDVIILDPDNDFQEKPAKSNVSKNDSPIEIVLSEDRTSDNIGQVAQSDWREQPIIAELDEKKHETPKGKDFREQKSNSRRKSARTRSSRRRISSKIKQQKTRYVEVTAVPRDVLSSSKKTDETTTILSSIITTTPSTITATPSTTTISTTIMPAATVAPFETRIAKQIDSHIFGEPESQTSKEVDTRAVGQRDATYSKNLQDDKGHDAGKNKETMRSFDHQITKYHGKNPEEESQHADKFEEEREEEGTEPVSYVEVTTSSQDTNLTEEPRSAEQAGSLEVTKTFEEDGYLEELSIKKQEALDDESNANADNEEPEKAVGKTPNKITHEITDSREDYSDLQEESSQRGNQAEELHVEDAGEEEEHSTNSKVTSYEYLDDYQDTTGSSAENTRDSSTFQEDYAESMNKEETPTTTVDYENFEEYTDSQEDVAAGTRGTESNTEGVLKFTDELPQLEEKDDEEAEEMLEADKDDTDDYVDDNYEPENYKEIETTVKPGASKEESTKEYDEMEEEDQDDIFEMETHTEHADDITDAAEEVADSTTTSSSTAMTSTTSSTVATVPTTTTTSTTMSTTSTTDSTTTPLTTTMTTSRWPMTTTSRGTPPKLFKPVGARKIYAFIPPTTTPIPVVIKPRLGLYNPKPAKPPKSYNELAPKPVIRKITLPTRKPASTTTTTTTTTVITADNTEDITATSAAITATGINAENLSTENPEATTEPITTITTTTTAATVMPSTTTTTESGRSEENVLESKLEPIEPIVSLHLPSSDNRENKDDQLSSSSEQRSDSPSSSNDTNARISTRKAEIFTPYPLSRLSTLAPPVEQTTQEETVEPYETTEKIDDILTIIPSTTLSPEETSVSYIEDTSSTTPSSTEEYPEEAATTLAPTKVYQEMTEAPSIPFEQSTSFPTMLATPNVQPNVITSTDPPAIFRPNIHKVMVPRKPMASFNCLEKEMYRFYGDTRDCRLFHYCSPGFTSRQVLDFRFVCEEGTAFDEETRSCRHDVRNRKCRNRSW